MYSDGSFAHPRHIPRQLYNLVTEQGEVVDKIGYKMWICGEVHKEEERDMIKLESMEKYQVEHKIERRCGTVSPSPGPAAEDTLWGAVPGPHQVQQQAEEEVLHHLQEAMQQGPPPAVCH